MASTHSSEIRTSADEAAVILTWNPAQGAGLDFDDVLDAVAAGDGAVFTWSVSNRRTVEAGESFWFLRQGSVRGIVARGTVLSEPFEPEAGEGWGSSRFVEIVFTAAVSDPDRPISTETLLSEVPDIKWNNLYRSGVGVAASDDVRLDAVWAAHERSHVLDPAARRTCPECGGAGKTIVYGLPTPEAFDDDRFVIGGCVVGQVEPRFACPECDHRWGSQ